MDVIRIDGSRGEGGGQILRTALALALATGRPFRIEKVRARRAKPGLRQQHLTAVLAAAKVGRAEVQGAVIGSREITFVPAAVVPGEYHFDVGTAGSTSLVLQTVLPPLLLASGPSRLLLKGGTHNIHAPPFDFVARAFVPLVRRMGPALEITLDRHGFYPAGGGQIAVSIQPSPLLPVEIVQRGRVVRREIRGMVSRLPLHIAQREVETARRLLGWTADTTSVEVVPSAGPGNAVIIEVQSENVTEVFTGFGERGVPAEKVATGAARETRRYVESGVPVGEHLADQLLLPLALAGGGRFRTSPLSAHATTNIDTLREFLDVKIEVEEISRDVVEVVIRR